MKRLVLANPKGGVGKSLLTILAVEWFSYQDGLYLAVTDADDNRTVQGWLEFCAKKGRPILQYDDPDLEIIDTAGLPGTIQPFVADADVVLTPFQGLTPDVARLVRWYRSLEHEHRARIYLVPNQVPNILSRDHKQAFELVERLLDSYGHGGHLLPGLHRREAVYGRLYNGSAVNFFEAGPNGSYANAQGEARALYRTVSQLLGLEVQR